MNTDDKCNLLVNKIGKIVGANILFLNENIGNVEPINRNLLKAFNENLKDYQNKCKTPFQEVVLSIRNKVYDDFTKKCLIDKNTPSQIISCLDEIEGKYPIIHEQTFVSFMNSIVMKAMEDKMGEDPLSEQSPLPMYKEKEDKSLYV